MQVTPENFLKFTAFAREQGVDLDDQDALARAMKTWYEGGFTSDLHKKDVVPPQQTRNWVYTNGPFTLHDNEVYSMVVSGGSPLMQWIPTGRMDAREVHVQHLSWIAPEGWTGQDYGAYLAGLTIGACEYGPAPDWSGFEYVINYGEASFRSDPLKDDKFGLRQSKLTPIYTVRGTPGIQMQTDADFALAQTALLLEQHLNWNVIYGVEGGNLQWDGLDQIMTPGYVAAHVTGAGLPNYTDPIVVDGSTLADAESVLKYIKHIVRKIRGRAHMRGWQIRTADMAVVMPMAFWPIIADVIACGAGSTCVGTGTLGASLWNTPRDAREERNRITSGYLGYGFIEVDGQPVPVIPEGALGVNGGTAEQPTVTGDIFVLVRQIAGIRTLENQFLNYGMLNLPPVDFRLMQGGIVKTGWITENTKCYYYFSEMTGRLVSRMQAFQGRITSVTLNTLLENMEESSTFTSSYWALEGQAGAGVLVPSP